MKKSAIKQQKDNNEDVDVIPDKDLDIQIEDYKREINRLSMKCDVLEKEVKYLLKNFSRRRNELDSLYEEHQRLISSRGYKFLEKLRKFKKIITGENKWKRKK